jgi:hypothetical protein
MSVCRCVYQKKIRLQRTPLQVADYWNKSAVVHLLGVSSRMCFLDVSWRVSWRTCFISWV